MVSRTNSYETTLLAWKAELDAALKVAAFAHNINAAFAAYAQASDAFSKALEHALQAPGGGG